MDEGPAISVEMRSDPCFLAGVRQLISGVAHRIGFGEAACSKIALAVDEALANVIRHGYGSDGSRPIWVRLWPLGSPETDDLGIRIVIEDEARHVETCELKGRDLDDPRPGGLGVHIIHEVMDNVQYEKRAPRGMRLTMEKFASDSDDA